MKPKEIAEQINKELLQGDVKKVISLCHDILKEEKTEKGSFTKTPLLNSIGHELGKLLVEREDKFEKLKGMWKNGERDIRLIVISAVGYISRKDQANAKHFVLGILDDITNWELCDQLALRIIVNLVVKNPLELFPIMEEWIKSTNKWRRRLAVATIPPYIRAKPEEAKRCLEFLNDAMKENDKDVKKAVGWALREITKKDPKSVFEFLKKWARINDKNTKWIVKEGMKKLNKEQQNKLKALMG